MIVEIKGVEYVVDLVIIPDAMNTDFNNFTLNDVEGIGELIVEKY